MAKVAISSQGATMESQVDPRFGRAAWFVVVDTDNMSHEAVDNGAAQAQAHGAGIQAAESLSRAGVGVVVSGVVGPKAYQALEAAGIQVVQEAKGTVSQALADYQAGRLLVGAPPMGGGMGPA